MFICAHFYFIISDRFYEVTVVDYFTVMIISHVMIHKYLFYVDNTLI